MKIAVIESNWDKFRGNVRTWWQKPRNDQLIKANNVQERSIGILQKRYGYTREEAIYQLGKNYPGAWLG